MFVKDQIKIEKQIKKQKDAVLKVLYKYHESIFNPKDAPMGIFTLSSSVELNEKRVKDVCELLSKAGLVKTIKLPSQGVFYKITAYGVQWIIK